MKVSFTHYILLLAIKFKGLKKIFSEYPINYKKLRNENVYMPKNRFLNKKGRMSTFTLLNSTITEIKGINQPNKLLIFIHGGAFISGPAQHHWNAVEKIVKQTPYTIWLVNYPKAPEYKISTISQNIDEIYDYALERFKSNDISIMGDSVGGTLTIALIQRLLKIDKALPHSLVLISPVMDATLSNPEITEIDKLDPMLSIKGVLSAKEMCAENNNLQDVSISPINGEFENFPKTLLFTAQHDITYPDQKRLVEKFNNANVPYHIVVGERMPHIWPLLPVMKEAKLSFNSIVNHLLKQ